MTMIDILFHLPYTIYSWIPIFRPPYNSDHLPQGDLTIVLTASHWFYDHLLQLSQYWEICNYACWVISHLNQEVSVQHLAHMLCIVGYIQLHFKLNIQEWKGHNQYNTFKKKLIFIVFSKLLELHPSKVFNPLWPGGTLNLTNCWIL